MPLDWNVNLIRLTLFSPATIAPSEKWWHTITGQEEAENRLALPGGGKQYSGSFAGGQLALVFTGPRLDAVLQAKDDTPELRLPIMGPWKELLASFVKAAEPLVGQREFPVVRLAFGAVLLAQTQSVDEAYEKLAQLLKSVTVDPSKMRDLQFRVNWPRQGKAHAVRLNRLTTWNSVRYFTKMMQVTGEQLAVATADSGLSAVRLEMDHNTDAAHATPFELATQMAILKELIALAEENAELGEIPC